MYSRRGKRFYLLSGFSHDPDAEREKGRSWVDARREGGELGLRPRDLHGC